MFQKVSDKFHRKQQSSASNKSNPSSAPSSPSVPKPVPVTSTSSAQAQNASATAAAAPTVDTTKHQAMDVDAAPSSPPPKTPAAGSSASSSLSNVPAQARTLSSALGVSSAIPENQQTPTSDRTMSVQMTDASEQQQQQRPDLNRNSSADEERIREKAREAQEQASLVAAQAQAALHNATQQARVAAINAAATQAALDTVSQKEVKPATAQPLRKTAGRYALADFQIERTLGTGSFGRVHLVRSKHNGRFYAVKVLNKEKVIKMKQVEHTNSEREMLVRVRHPFLVNLWGTFQDVNNLYMVMDFVAGGELFSLLRKSQRFPNSVAKFYAAEVALALDYLHSLDIIYRDLKPENLLLGADGHVKVTDFGFAKHVPDITWTLCGTPDYLAPEVVQSKGYNKSVDWYALGVLIFEMLAGYPPFFTEDGNPMKLYEKIIAGKVRYPTYFDPLAKELLKNLLVGDLTKRYGNLRAGSSDIFAHGWFAEVDWDKLYRREIPAPYVPKIEGEGDASQFDRYQEADVSAYGKAGTGPYDHFFTEF
ncbi:AGC/PKA protein kinase [Kwoniella heveanensis CBS 569]|nr:AGC/PKA protein kinase [Kwoniella heveanensis CBS 569]